MHNVKRVHLSPEAIAAKKLREQSKIKEYIALTDEVVAKKGSKDWSRDSFDLTTRILRINPEFFTAWNYRRNILLNGIFPQSSAAEINELLTDELSMTTVALKTHPKVYWIWNHRRWCLENTPSGPEGDVNGWRQTNWDREMFVVDKMLDADSRNFMAWDYRRYCLANMPVPRPETAELAYTTRKIEANFSNFSAWHQRSKVLSSLWASGKLDSSKSKEDEFELVRNAMYTDPNDQSVWIYHRWLIGDGDDKAVLDREIEVIRELLDEQSDSKWCMESLVHYKRLLLKKHSSSLDVASVQNECRELLSQLRAFDPMRQRRYEEIEKQL